MRIRDTSTKEIFIQVSNFETITRDWNCDGDVYPIYGACFESEKDGLRDFINESWISEGADNYYEIIER